MGNEELWNNTNSANKMNNQTLTVAIDAAAHSLITGDLAAKIAAARDVRTLVRRSKSAAVKTRSRLAAAGVIQPLVLLLLSSKAEAREASLLALLNLAVRNER